MRLRGHRGDAPVAFHQGDRELERYLPDHCFVPGLDRRDSMGCCQPHVQAAHRDQPRRTSCACYAPTAPEQSCAGSAVVW